MIFNEGENMKNNSTNIYIKLLSISTTIIAIFIIVNLFTFSTEPSSGEKNNRDESVEKPSFKKDYSIFSLDIPKNLNFAKEKVPVDKHWVKESFDRELLVNTYWQSQTLLLIKRSKRYFPIIEPILKKEGVPDDFKYLAVIESSLMPRSISPAGAAGIWQFMPKTARGYGLEVNDEVDERYHVEKATVAACKYIKKSYEKFHNWTLVAASYNAGQNGVYTQIKRQKADDYYNLLFGSETGRYVYRILAAKEILSNPPKYGFHVDEDDCYAPIPTKHITINSPVKDIADLALEYGLSYKELKDLNPWLRDNILTNSRNKTYVLNIPVHASLSQKENLPTQEVITSSSNQIDNSLKLKNNKLSIE